LAEIGIAAASADSTGAPTESEPLLSVRLRRRLRSEVIAVEQVRDRDLTDAIAEIWMEGYLRKGFAEVEMGEVEVQLRTIYRQNAEAGRYCDGFELEIRNPGGAATRRFFSRECLAPVAERGSRRLLEDGTLQTGDLFFYDMAIGDGEALVNASGAGRTDAELTLRGPESRGAPGHLRVPLRLLLDRSEAESPYTADAPYPIFFTRSARERAERISRKGADVMPPVETGGLLIGPLCVCPDSGEMFAVILDVLEAADSEATTHTLTYSSATWARIQAILRARQADPATRHHRIIGQTHGHNFLPFDGAAQCDECPHRAECTRSTAHLSAADRTWARAVFNGEPWSVSQVFGLDPRSNPVEAFYGQRGGSLVKRGYGVIDDFDEALVETGGD
jgi:hypothetical protein